jgi:hypothetical protein
MQPTLQPGFPALDASDKKFNSRPIASTQRKAQGRAALGFLIPGPPAAPR